MKEVGWRRFRLRIRLTVASFLLSALVVTGAVAGASALVRDEVGSLIRGRLQDRVSALVATLTFGPSGVDIAGADDRLLDSPNWVFDPRGALVEGSIPKGPVGRTVRRLGRTTHSRTVAVGDLHLAALPVRHGGAVVAVAVSAVDASPYLATVDAVTRDGVLLGLLAVVGATGLAALVLGRSLGPMTAMAERAAEWSRHRSGSRFQLGPPRDELTVLGAVLDDLLNRVDTALTAERRLTAEIAHELRSPLTVLCGEADIAILRAATPASELPRYRRIRDSATAMSRAISTLLADSAEADEGETDTVVKEAVQTVLDALRPQVQVSVTGPEERVAVRFVLLERILAPLLDNAVAAAVRRVDVVVDSDEDDVVVRISDDGPGVDPLVAGRLFDPGVTTKPSGTGIGLALARRLVHEAGGSIVLVSSSPAMFEVRLPRLIGSGGLRRRQDSVAAE